MLLLGCGATVTPGAPDASPCPEGLRLVYTQGCDGRAAVCGPDTSGDAVVLVFCGCDGQDIRTNQSPPLRPWRHAGSCAADAGPPPADVPQCPLAPLAITACARDEDCAQVRRGCYCGRQPVTGVAERFRIDADRCEREAERSCALGCPVQSGLVADDGRDIDDGGTIANRCERGDGGAGVCRTYVP